MESWNLGCSRSLQRVLQRDGSKSYSKITLNVILLSSPHHSAYFYKNIYRCSSSNNQPQPLKDAPRWVLQRDPEEQHSPSLSQRLHSFSFQLFSLLAVTQLYLPYSLWKNVWLEESNMDLLTQGTRVIFWIGLVLEMGGEWGTRFHGHQLYWWCWAGAGVPRDCLVMASLCKKKKIII